MEKILGFVKVNKGAILKGALITVGGVAVAALTKMGLERFEDDILEGIENDVENLVIQTEDFETEEEEA